MLLITNGRRVSTFVYIGSSTLLLFVFPIQNIVFLVEKKKFLNELFFLMHLVHTSAVELILTVNLTLHNEAIWHCTMLAFWCEPEKTLQCFQRQGPRTTVFQIFVRFKGLLLDPKDLNKPQVMLSLVKKQSDQIIGILLPFHWPEPGPNRPGVRPWLLFIIRVRVKVKNLWSTTLNDGALGLWALDMVIYKFKPCCLIRA